MSKKSRKLVLYSGGQLATNARLHEALVGLTGSRRNLTMTYIPYCEEGSKAFFNRFKKRYSKFGAKRFNCLPVDKHFTKQDLKVALKSDVIYLAGGNTFYFLKHLRQSGVLKLLKEFSLKGGVLAGLSAGAIMLTPHIELAGYPPFDPDENDVGIKNLRALGLVKFEFLPHFVNSKRMNEAMLMYSLLTKNPIYACTDGSGIVLNGHQKTYFGEVYVFHRGIRINLDPR